MYEDRNFVIFNVSELDKVDFSQVLETSEETVRKSVDGTKAFVKWNGQQPGFVSEMTTAEGPYTYAEVVAILAGTDWTPEPTPMV